MQAGQNISIQAKGAQAASSLTVLGSSLQAGGNIALQAQGDVSLKAAQQTSSLHSSDSSSGASLGVALKVGGKENGLSVNASANKAKGRGDGSETTWANTLVDAGQQLSITSGVDTTLAGAVAKGQQVVVNTGGQLSLQSLQDTSTYDSKSTSMGVGVTVCIPGLCDGTSSVNANLGKTRINSNFASVAERTGIQAGDQGFQVSVAGKTDLQGAVIASTDKAVQDGKNTLNTQGLSLSNIDNKAEFKAQAYSVNVGTSAGQSSAGLGQASDQAASTTTAGVSGIAGDTSVRTGDQQQGIETIFDKDKVGKDVNAQVTITAEFGKQAAKAVGDYGQSKTKPIDDASLRQDLDRKLSNNVPLTSGEQEALARLNREGMTPSQAAANLSNPQLKQDHENWKEGGTYRVALHTVAGGLNGGLGGALGAGASSAAANSLDNLQGQLQGALQQAGLPEVAAKGIASVATGATAATLGAALGGTAGAAAGFSQDMNNRQLHPSERQRIETLAKQKAQSMCRGDSSCVVSATLYWSDMLERAAEGRVDTQEAVKNQSMYEDMIKLAGQPKTEASMGAALNFFQNLSEAQLMLNADAGKPILDGRGNVVLGTDGKPQTYFSATQAQRDNPYGNIFPGGSPSTQASIIPGKERRDQERLENMAARNGQTVPDTTIDEFLIGLRLPVKGVGSVVKVTERGAAEALPGTAKAAEEALLRSGGAFDKAGNPLLDMSKLTTEQKRVVGEQLFGPNTVRQIVPEGKQLARVQGQGSNGIDELYKVNRPDVDYVSVEYKFVGQDNKTGAQVLKNTGDGKQGSESWLGGSGRLEKAVGGGPQADAVRDALKQNRVESWVVTVRPDGSTSVQVLDALGRVKPVEASKILDPLTNLSGAKK